MVIKTNTTQKKANELDYKELLAKLNSKELLEQGAQLLLETQKPEPYHSDYAVLVYDHSVNQFRFITIKAYSIGFTEETAAGELIIETTGKVIKELEFPKNTLVCVVSTTDGNKKERINDNHDAKTIIRKTIKQARKTIEEQFVTAPLNKGLERAFIEENPEWPLLNKCALLNLFPQFKTDERKRLENAFLIAKSLFDYSHTDLTDSIIDTIKKQDAYLDESPFHAEERIDSLKKLLKQQLTTTLSQEELLELIQFLRQEYVDSFLLFENSLTLNQCNGHNAHFCFWLGGEFYYAMINRIIELLNKKPELKTERVTKELTALGAPFLNKNYQTDQVASLALSFNNLLPIASKDNVVIQSELINTMSKEFDCTNRVFFIEDFFVARLINSNVRNKFMNEPELINDLIGYLKENNCSFVVTEKTKGLMETFLALHESINQSLEDYPVNYYYESELFGEDNAFRFFIHFLSLNTTVIENDYQAKGLAFFYEKE